MMCGDGTEQHGVNQPPTPSTSPAQTLHRRHPDTSVPCPGGVDRGRIRHSSRHLERSLHGKLGNRDGTTQNHHLLLHIILCMCPVSSEISHCNVALLWIVFLINVTFVAGV